MENVRAPEHLDQDASIPELDVSAVPAEASLEDALVHDDLAESHGDSEAPPTTCSTLASERSTAYVRAASPIVQRAAPPAVPASSRPGSGVKPAPRQSIASVAPVELQPTPEIDATDFQFQFNAVDDIIARIDRDSAQPPKPPQLAPVRGRLATLKDELAKSRGSTYLDEFEHDLEDHALVVGHVPLQQIQEEEKRQREERVKAEMEHVRQHRDLEASIVTKTEQAKKSVMNDYEERQQKLQQYQSDLRQRDRMRMQEMHKAFHRSEQHLLDVLAQGKDGVYSGSNSRRWKTDWERSPQPIQIKLKYVRGVRDKLPRAQYLCVVSLYDRLGGQLLRWSTLKGQQWSGATLPMSHDGRFSSPELLFNQSVFTVCPPKKGIRPGMVLVFELYLLRGDVSPVDRVVGWGVFPIADSEFNVISGKYKTPLAKGIVNPHITMHARLEHLFASDVDNWLGNLYFEVVKLPRYVSGQKEYEVELQYTSGLLAFPERAIKAHDNMQAMQEEAAQIVDEATRRDHVDVSPEASTKVPGEADRVAPVLGVSAQLRRRTPSSKLSQSRLARRQSAVSARNPNDSNEDSAEEAEEAGSSKVEVEPGLAYTVHVSKLDQYQQKLYRLQPKLRSEASKKPLTKDEELAQHSVSVVPPFTGQIKGRSKEKTEYVVRQVYAELGFSQMRARPFWMTMFFLVLCFWMRLYTHYFGQWVFLQALKIPVAEFTFKAVTVNLNYQATLLLAREEVGVVCFGPLFVIGVFAVLILTAFLSMRFLGAFNRFASYFTFAWGLHTILDPVLIAIVDLAYQRWNADSKNVAVIGDIFKLYWNFQRSDGDGLPGVFLTIFLYVILMFLSITLFYFYFLKWHLNGRLLDVYQRLNCPNDQFFIPYDLEVSNRELGRVIKKSEQWRGKHGERRKVAVYDYVWEEDEPEASGGPVNREVTTHISVHTIYLDGTRELHRQFLKLPDGAIIEVLGNATEIGNELNVKQALDKSHVSLQKLIQKSTKFINDTLQGEGELGRGTVTRGGDAPGARPLTGLVRQATNLSTKLDFSMRPHTSHGGKGSHAAPL